MTATPARFRAGLLGLLAVLPALADAGAGAKASDAARPNIVFLYADDLGYGDLGCQGHPRIQTPNLDRLAREGTRFTQFYLSHSVCSPTRASAITGQYPSRWRIYGPLGSLATNAARGMPDWLDVAAPSMPRAMQQAGYRTAHFGKWHLGGGSGSRRGGRVVINHPDAPPVAAYGFDVVRTDFGNGPTWRAAEPVDRPHELYPYDEPEWQTWSSRAISDATIGFLDEQARDHRGRPFLVHVWFKDPHTPMKPTDTMRAPYRDVPEPAQTHYAMVSFMDQQIGRILAKLDELGLRENTLVVFSSDNGAAVGRGGSNAPFRGGKWYLDEGGIRAPFIVRWPRAGGVPAGRVDTTSVLNICDLAPTFLSLAGGRMPEGYRGDGVDATAAILGQPFRREEPMMWHHPTRYNSRQALAIREGVWKLLMDPDGSALELYDIATDPGEQRNVAAENPPVVARLRVRLEAWYDSLPRPHPPLLNHEIPRVAISAGTASAPEVEIEHARISRDFTPIHPVLLDAQGTPVDLTNGFCRGAPLRLADGRLMMAFGDDSRRFSYSSALFAAFSGDGGRTWTDTRIIERNPDSRLRHGRPAAVQARDGTIWVFYYALRESDGTPAGSSSDVWAISSTDNGRTFGNRRKIWEGYCGMLQGAIQTRAGHLLVPISFLAERQKFDAGCIVSADEGRTWRFSDIVTLGEADAELRATTKLNAGALEPAVAELADGTILMTLRTLLGRIYVARSEDGGWSWPQPVESGLTCGGTQYLTRLADGHLALVWSEADFSNVASQKWPNGLARLAIAFSADGGRTWTKPRTLAQATAGRRLVHTLLVETAPGVLLLTMPERNFLLEARLAQLLGR